MIAANVPSTVKFELGSLMGQNYFSLWQVKISFTQSTKRQGGFIDNAIRCGKRTSFGVMQRCT
jgi:hypothetical protein